MSKRNILLTTTQIWRLANSPRTFLKIPKLPLEICFISSDLLKDTEFGYLRKSNILEIY